MFSRRDFISGHFKPGKNPVCNDAVEIEGDSQEKTRAIASDFSDEMLYREMMRLGKDPSNMDRKQMLQTVIGEMRIK